MAEHGRQIDLELNYEHNFNRPTFNMCKGQFGRGSRRQIDLISIKSNSRISFFEVKIHRIMIIFVFKHSMEFYSYSKTNVNQWLNPCQIRIFLVHFVISHD